ncbi:MAG TPA: hypothetical protein VG125_12565 [Pirellulales bacterium]|jgi:hypothetical protein|nr:hypothetical protein [Pirellulales bacterium]
MPLDLPTMRPDRPGRGRELCSLGDAIAELMARYELVVATEPADSDCADSDCAVEELECPTETEFSFLACAAIG